jgi:hypothetical protein
MRNRIPDLNKLDTVWLDRSVAEGPDGSFTAVVIFAGFDSQESAQRMATMMFSIINDAIEDGVGPGFREN